MVQGRNEEGKEEGRERRGRVGGREGEGGNLPSGSAKKKEYPSPSTGSLQYIK